VAMTFGDLTDATNTARRETPLVVVDGNGVQYTVQQVDVEVSPEGAVTAVKLTAAST
jgi:hypothetical protein